MTTEVSRFLCYILHTPKLLQIPHVNHSLFFFLAIVGFAQLSNFIIPRKCSVMEKDNNNFLTRKICTRVVYGKVRLIIAFRRKRPE